MTKRSEPEDFWKKVNIKSKDECWEWSAVKDKVGYGKLGYQGKLWLAHRLAYFLHYGEMPKLACHKCDNPSCCNPHHLFSGTHKDNRDDMVEKGRRADQSGERNPRAVASAKMVKEIKTWLTDKNITQISIARAYKIDTQIIWKIANNVTWKTIGAF